MEGAAAAAATPAADAVPRHRASIDAVDREYIDMCKTILHTKPAPIQSNLLVVAVITYVDKDGERRSAKGINSEPCVIAGSLCAERSALTRYAP
jgi:hypothetical protein